MRKSKKLLSLALASLMTVSSFACLGSVSAFAAEGDPQPQVLKGDVNKDGVVDVEDATLIQLYAIDDPHTLAKFESGEYSAEAADVDGSGQSPPQPLPRRPLQSPPPSPLRISTFSQVLPIG